jgi:hypothetical protein
MREYILWRDGLAIHGGDRKSRFHGDNLDLLPSTDPGHLVAHRWRKALKDVEAFEQAVEAARECCRRICEQENLELAF